MLIRAWCATLPVFLYCVRLWQSRPLVKGDRFYLMFCMCTQSLVLFSPLFREPRPLLVVVDNALRVSIAISPFVLSSVSLKATVLGVMCIMWVLYQVNGVCVLTSAKWNTTTKTLFAPTFLALAASTTTRPLYLLLYHKLTKSVLRQQMAYENRF